ncbi:FecR family protein [Pedobacter nototheniae]|uniref:FecR family protein n=1 Tax=Pedobacter nototheniae TaxID=2488994 RepID=UPI00103B1ABB|nr:FecR domain-containing protein [Pedobacter nototheniae]
MTEEQAKQLLQKYLNQEATPEEIKRVEQWYAIVNNKESDLSAEKKAAIGQQVFLNLQAAMQPKTKLRALFNFKAFVKVAAILLLVATLAISIWKISNNGNSNQNLVVVCTKATERKKVILPDGSEILLEPSAKISYPAQFGTSHRKLSLMEGEAFFNIAHESKRSFIVSTTSGVNVKVLGTSFRIKAYNTQQNIQVAVATGKVAVSNQKGLMGTLIKDEQLDYDKNANRISIRKIKQAAYVDFAFEGSTLQQVINKLEYAYSIKILLADTEMAKLKCTAVFSSKQQPEEILDIICSLHHLKFSPSKNNKTFKIYR